MYLPRNIGPSLFRFVLVAAITAAETRLRLWRRWQRGITTIPH
ncbi:MAG TPA: hypothetical protein VJ258_07255 [Candidatus Limnocylindrales bacterium]|nr:hypothetical protein [Candidatus Limnocylindrales bacterium]